MKAVEFSGAAAAFVHGLRNETLPPPILARARVLLLNSYAIGLGGLELPVAKTARIAALLQGSQAAGGATLLGNRQRVPLTAAMQANAALFHARVQDDTNGSSHFGVVLVPMLTALAESGLPLADFLPSLVAGYEVGALLDSRLSRGSAAHGFRGTPLFGAIAAAASASRYMGLPVEQVRVAISMSASFTGGLLQSFSQGTDEWRLQPGVAATVGYLAATYAAAGATGSASAFSGARGFDGVFAGDAALLAAAADSLGVDWAVEKVTFKPFPVAMFNQAVVHAGRKLRGHLAGGKPKRVSISLHPFEAAYPSIADPGPFESSAGALMSAPVCLALTLAHGEPTLANLESSALGDVRDVAAVTTVIADASLERLSCRVSVECADGRAFEVTAGTGFDTATFDMPDALGVLQSICVQHRIPHRAAELLHGLVCRLPGGDIGDVAEAFAMAPATTDPS